MAVVKPAAAFLAFIWAVLLRFALRLSQKLKTHIYEIRAAVDHVCTPAPTRLAVNAPPASTEPSADQQAVPANITSWCPDQGCVRRAALLSRIVYLPARQAERELQLYEGKLGFKFVHLQKRECENVQQMVVAMDRHSTLYVCFRGTQGIQDLITDGLFGQAQFTPSADLGVLDNAIQGSYHQGFLLCLDQKVFSMRSLHSLMRSRSCYNARRVVFCGHSLGGALAHLAVIKYMLANANSIGRDTGEVAAIAFAAPHICDQKARTYLRQHVFNIEKKLYNFVALQDPVPFLLNSLPMSAQLFSKGALEMGPSWIAETVIYKLFAKYQPLAKKSLEWLVQHAVSIACESFTSAEVVRHIGSVIGATLNRAVQQNKVAHNCKCYVPIGNWFTCDGCLGTDAAGELVEQLRDSDIARHGMSRYFEDLCIDGADGRPRWRFTDDFVSIPAFNSTNLYWQEPQVIQQKAAPRIREALWYVEENMIIVRGEGLELIVQARVDGEVWPDYELLLDKDCSKVRLNAPEAPASTGSGSATPRHAEELQLFTCFGEAKHAIRIQYSPVSGLWPDSRLAFVYQQCSLKLGLLVKLNLPGNFQEELKLLRLTRDDFLRSSGAAAETWRLGSQHWPAEDNQFGRLVSQLWPPVIHRVLKECLFKSIDIDGATEVSSIMDNMGAYSGKGALCGGAPAAVLGGIIAGIGETGLALSTSAQIAIGVAGVGLPVAGVAALGAATFCLGKNLFNWYYCQGSAVSSSTVINYKDVLQLTASVLGLQLSKSDISELELTIGKEFKEGRSRHIQLRDSIGCDPSDNCHGRAAVSANANRDGPDLRFNNEGATIARRSVAECVGRAEFMNDVVEAGERLSRKVKVVLVVGPQNAGKSSLINCIVGKEVARTGYWRVHTEDLKGYHVERKGRPVVLVDSPGLDSDNRLADMKGIWRSLEGVPDLVIMVMRFQGDTDELVQQLPASVAKWSKCLNLLLVLNQCDQILSYPSSLEEFSPQGMVELQADYAGRAHLRPEDVIMTVLADQPVNSHDRQQLASDLEERGVLHKPKATRCLLDRIESLMNESPAGLPMCSS
ncbi:hypothetical protein L7F22_045944 [Adiantum nelumboides]|nr:hypothetical protein [Adiantum nelumboides]